MAYQVSMQMIQRAYEKMAAKHPDVAFVIDGDNHEIHVIEVRDGEEVNSMSFEEAF